MPKLAPTSPILHSDHSSSGNETNLNNSNSNNSNSNCSDSNSSPSEIKMILCQPEIQQQPADFQNNTLSNQPGLEILDDISKTENNSQILHRYNDPLTSILSFDSQDNFDYDRHLTSGSRNNYFELDGGFNDSIPY